MEIRGIFSWVVALATVARSDSKTTTVGVCRTKACDNVASDLSYRVNPYADPCTNFYDFACAGFDWSYQLFGYMNYRTILQHKIWSNIDELLTSAVDPKEPRPFKLVKTFYKSCIDETMIDQKGLEPLRRLVQELGGWPVVDGACWVSDNFDWRRAFYMFRSDESDDYWRYGDRLGYLLFSRISNYESPTSIELVQSAQGAPWTADPIDFADTGSRPYIYYESLINIAVMLGADHRRAATSMKLVMMLEKQLAALKRDNANFTTLPLGELKTKYPTVPWITYIRNFLPSSKALDDTQLVFVYNIDYYVQLEAIMATVPKKIQANYIMSKIVLRYGIYSTSDMRSVVENALGPYFHGRDRRHYCYDETMKYMWRAVTAVYADKYFSDEIRNDIFHMFETIVDQMKQQVKKNQRGYWTEIDRIEEANERINNMSIQIGHPSELLNITILDELYENLTFTEDDYFGNMKALSRHDRELSIKKITRPYENWTLTEWEEWRGASTDVTRAIVDSMKIWIGDAFFRDLYYDIRLPKYMNYGGVGTVIAHEISHLILESGYSWNNTYQGLRHRKEFDDVARCLVDQYDNLPVGLMGKRLDGAKTLSENAADVGGVRLAYEAYKQAVKGKPEEPKLPGFNKYSDKQMFWLNVAGTMCETIPPAEMAAVIANNGNHTPDKFRMIGMIANMPEFAQDFNCTAPSILNPVKRCEVFAN